MNELSHREGATLFMTLIAALLALLHRYTGQEDILLGTATAGRNHAEIEKLIGFFINTLVLRTDLSGNPSFCELLGRVREVALGAYDHQDVPFEKLVEELQPERDMSRHPFFQVMVNFQTTESVELTCGGLKLTPQDPGEQARFDLELHLLLVLEGVIVTLLYNTDLFEKSMIARMMRHFETLLEGIAANPEARLSELPLLTREEQEQLRELNQTSSEYEHDKCVHQLVEMQTARQPEAVAVIYGAEQITYRELNTRANQLAHYLRRRGVGAEVRVGVLLERSVDLIVALLGILKAGGAYVPLDGGSPAPRLRFMLEDAAVTLLLTRRGQPEVLTQGDVVYLDEGWEKFGSEDLENPVVVTSADNLAYVMYTSGSTGQPKGVEVTHRAINRLVRNTNYVHLEESDRVAQVSNAAFDAATFEVWGALLHGAQLVGIQKETMLSPAEFKREILDQHINVMFLTTSLFNQIAQTLPETFTPFRYLLFGGEASDPRSVRRVLESGKPRHLLNAYGPTESTTFATWYEVEEVETGARTIPIGQPLSNTEVWVLDQHMQLVPFGVMGELYIGGEGLARDYLQRPELTAEKFVPHPYSAKPGARLYRTGDLVRYLHDGNIEFLKRLDQQVKIRGFRIELGEIEAALQEHLAVRESVVIAHEEMAGDRQLVAYVVRDPNVQPATEQLISQLRSCLRARLPDYMTPSNFVVLDELPLNANGKVDHRALPRPDTARHITEATFISPRTPDEKQIAEIWAGVLDVGPISADANFFDLGGHSLLATRIISRIRETCGVELPLRLLFDFPTVETLASQLAAAQHRQTDAGSIAEMLETVVSLSEDETKTLLERKEA
nr:AMP-dependent synthetase and ligase [uncultured bacterium]